MKKVNIFLTIILSSGLLTTPLRSQIIESFSDGDFTSNPAWAGETGKWQIITDSSVAAGASNSFTLQLNTSESTRDTSYLSLQRTDSWGTDQSWGVWMGMNSTSTVNSGNQSMVWLWASEADLKSATVDGYRVRLGPGGGGQTVHVDRIDNGVETTLITAASFAAGIVSDYGLLVRVTRTAPSQWTLFTSTFPSASGEGELLPTYQLLHSESRGQNPILQAYDSDKIVSDSWRASTCVGCSSRKKQARIFDIPSHKPDEPEPKSFLDKITGFSGLAMRLNNSKNPVYLVNPV